MVTKENAMEVYLFGLLYKVASLDDEITDAEINFTQAVIPKMVKKSVNLEEILRIYQDSELDDLGVIKEASMLLPIKDVVGGAKQAITLALFDGKFDQAEQKHINLILENAKVSKRQIVSLWKLAERHIADFEAELKARSKTSNLSKKELKEELLKNHFHQDGILNCPRCEDLFLDLFHIEGLEFDFCYAGCHGIWTDHGELEKYISAEVGNMPYHKADFSKLEKAEIDCPRCQIPLYHYNYLDQGLFIDVCKKCHGAWLDSSELGHLRTISVKAGFAGKINALDSFLSGKGLQKF